MATFSDDFPKGYPRNHTWLGPEPGIGDLPVHLRVHRSKSHPQQATTESISCWRLSPAEIEEVKRTGRVFLSVWGRHPPVSVYTALDLDVEAEVQA